MARTAAEIQAEIDKTTAAIQRLLDDGQAWQRGERSRTEARLEELRLHRAKLESELADVTRGGARVREIVPLR